jgi:adenylate kinase
MGAQGSGKGTQAALLGPKHGLVRLATGDMFRAAIASRSELGLELEGILNRGDLVPDDLTNNLVRHRLAEIAEAQRGSTEPHGVLFDGFPRTAEQARALDEILAENDEALTAVIEIDVPRDVLIDRMAGRRVCVICGHVYQLETNPPKVAGICDLDGGELVQRDDDKPDAIARRLALYDELTAPLANYYRDKGLLSQVNGDQQVDEVAADIDAVLAARKTR